MNTYNEKLNTANKPDEKCLIDISTLQISQNRVSANLNLIIFLMPFPHRVYAAISAIKIDSEALIKIYKEAFLYFGTTPHDCLYSHSFSYLNLETDKAFHEYVNKAGIKNVSYQSFSPNDKGVIERELTEIERSICLENSSTSMNNLELLLLAWLDKANSKRIHSTLHKTHQPYFDQEKKPRMLAYQSPSFLQPTDKVFFRMVNRRGIFAGSPEGTLYHCFIKTQRLV